MNNPTYLIESNNDEICEETSINFYTTFEEALKVLQESNYLERLENDEYIIISEISSDETTFEVMLYLDKKLNPLQFARRLKNYTQNELSIKSGVNLRTIQKLETGERALLKTSGETLLKLSKALNQPIDFFLE